MMRNLSSLRLLSFGILMLFACQVSTVSAQSTRPNRGNKQAKLTPHEFSIAFWNYLTKFNQNDYKEWKSLPGKKPKIGETEENPHGEFMKVFANKQAVGNPLNLPYNSIIVAENYEDDKETLRSITVMYRNRGFNPDRNDWYWIMYKPNGDIAFRVFDRHRRHVAGRVGYCMSCHQKAEGSDYVFTNDDLDPEKIKKMREEAAAKKETQ